MSVSELWNEEEQEWIFPHPLHYIKQRKPFNGHYPNKNESKVLRKIMSKTGLTEKEVRNIKKYRIMLSEAQKQSISKLALALINSGKTDLELADFLQVSLDNIKYWKQSKNLPHKFVSIRIIESLSV